MQPTLNEAVRSYYNARSESFFDIWGGEYIHYGIYDTGDESLADASRETVEWMFNGLRLGLDDAPSRVLDLGSGFGSAARHFASHGHRVTCIDLSAENNATHRRINAEQDIDGIDILERSFESLPFADASFDVVWSQEALCHTDRLPEVFAQVHRVLAPGGRFTLSNTCVSESIPDEVHEKLERRNPVHLLTIDAHTERARAVGLELETCRDFSDHLTTHYAKMIENVRDNRARIVAREDEDYYERALKGLGWWHEVCENGWLAWGIWRFRKPG